MNDRRFLMSIPLLAVMCSLLPVRAEDAHALARRLLDQAGVKGGLVVHLGCGTGELTAALGASGSYVVQGLDRDPSKVQSARRKLTLGAVGYGRVAVRQLMGDRLPYVDNLVQLAVVSDLSGVSAEEVRRVLSPGGVALFHRSGRWTKSVKPRPAELDEWTHYLHDPTNNAVSHDSVVGPPRHMQWMAGPDWLRYHHNLASVSGAVTANGRLFSVVDRGPSGSIQAPSEWTLVARDAFSGVLLWQRPLPSWAYHLRRFRSGPVQLPRLLVAVGERLYVPLAEDAPVSILDAATGKVQGEIESSHGAEEVLVIGQQALVLTGSPHAEQVTGDPARRGEAPFPNKKALVLADADSGRARWRRECSEEQTPVPQTLACDGERIFFYAPRKVVALEMSDGETLWETAVEGANVRKNPGGVRKGKRRGRAGASTRSPGWAQSTLVVSDGVVLVADGGKLSAVDADKGRVLWTGTCASKGFRSPPDVLVIGDEVWTGPDFAGSRDLRTGKPKRALDIWAALQTAGHHHRCYREKATDRFLLAGYRGIELVGLKEQVYSRNNWVRGLCQYGIMPANGLLHAPPHSCGCFMEAKLRGLWALAPERQSATETDDSPRLVRGPAYGDVQLQARPLATDWPMHRHDPARSGATVSDAPNRLAERWRIPAGVSTAPVVAGELLVVAGGDSHRVVGLDAGSGEYRWDFIAGGRVDSAPTLYRGLVLFGCADGWVYCLRARDGELVWRFRAAPAERQAVAHNQLESVWPVRGSVLVRGDVVYCAAGRDSYIDGGIALWGLDPLTGRAVKHSVISSPQVGAQSPTPDADQRRARIDQNATDYKTFVAPDRSDAFSMAGNTNDILVADGKRIYLRHMALDNDLRPLKKFAQHLFSTSDLLDPAENHRSHWVLGSGDFSRTPVAYSWIANRPNGRNGTYLARPYGVLLSFARSTVWGVRRGKDREYSLFAQTNTADPNDGEPDFRKMTSEQAPKWEWSVPLNMRPRALVRAGDRLLVAGMEPDKSPDEFEAFEGKRGGIVWMLSTTDGRKLAEVRLTRPPVWDGMSVANGNVFVTTMDGLVICLGG